VMIIPAHLIGAPQIQQGGINARKDQIESNRGTK